MSLPLQKHGSALGRSLRFEKLLMRSYRTLRFLTGTSVT